MQAGKGPRFHRRSGKIRRWVAVKMRVRGAGHLQENSRLNAAVIDYPQAHLGS